MEVEKLIDAIGEVTLDDEEAIKDAREAYNALTSDQKALVKNATKALEDAEKALEELKKESEEEDDTDKKAAERVEKLIDAIGPVSINSGRAIKAARDAYNALTPAQKALVKNVNTLTAAEAMYALLTRPVPTEPTIPAPSNPSTPNVPVKPDVKLSFVDVKKSDYFYDAVLWAVENDVTKGTSANTFSPAASCTRAQTVTFLWRAAGAPEPTATKCDFVDLDENAYYFKAVLWAVENGITNGVDVAHFAPDATVTRAQVVTFQYRAAKAEATGSNSFVDVPTGAYYEDAVNWAVANGITNGTSDTTFSPDADFVRAQIVTFLYRAAK